jgi:peptidyl-prolyl cis-trans isomerase B (cyclophilin B)
MRASYASPLLMLSLALLAACNQAPPATAPITAKPEIPGPNLATLSDTTAPAALLAYGQQYPGSEVLVKTRLGNIRVKLYDDTPIHKANFLLLARKGVFDETMFNRVVKDFAVQGGQTYEARTIRLKRYRLPPEFRSEHFHHKGALGMARYDDEKNPGHLSSNTDFYFVVGEKLDPNQSAAMAGRKLTPAQVKAYATQGGVPSLDGKYTVFGEVIEGQDVVDKIASEPVESDKWPVKDIPIKVEVVK